MPSGGVLTTDSSTGLSAPQQMQQPSISGGNMMPATGVGMQLPTNIQSPSSSGGSTAGLNMPSALTAVGNSNVGASSVNLTPVGASDGVVGINSLGPITTSSTSTAATAVASSPGGMQSPFAIAAAMPSLLGTGAASPFGVFQQSSAFGGGPPGSNQAGGPGISSLGSTAPGNGFAIASAGTDSASGGVEVNSADNAAYTASIIRLNPDTATLAYRLLFTPSAELAPLVQSVTATVMTGNDETAVDGSDEQAVLVLVESLTQSKDGATWSSPPFVLAIGQELDYQFTYTALNVTAPTALSTSSVTTAPAATGLPIQAGSPSQAQPQQPPMQQNLSLPQMGDQQVQAQSQQIPSTGVVSVTTPQYSFSADPYSVEMHALPGSRLEVIFAGISGLPYANVTLHAAVDSALARDYPMVAVSSSTSSSSSGSPAYSAAVTQSQQTHQQSTEQAQSLVQLYASPILILAPGQSLNYSFSFQIDGVQLITASETYAYASGVTQLPAADTMIVIEDDGQGAENATATAAPAPAAPGGAAAGAMLPSVNVSAAAAMLPQGSSFSVSSAMPQSPLAQQQLQTSAPGTASVQSVQPLTPQQQVTGGGGLLAANGLLSSAMPGPVLLNSGASSGATVQAQASAAMTMPSMTSVSSQTLSVPQQTQQMPQMPQQMPQVMQMARP